MKSCSFCSKTFSKTEHLLRHERSHTGERPYQCNKCHRRYARSDVLLRHAKSFHGPSPPGQTNEQEKQRQPAETSLDHSERSRAGSVESDPGNDDTNDASSVGSVVHAHSLPTQQPSPPYAEPPVAHPAGTTDLDALATASMLHARHDSLDPSAEAVLASMFGEPQPTHQQQPQPTGFTCQQDFVIPGLTAGQTNMGHPSLGSGELLPPSFPTGDIPPAIDGIELERSALLTRLLADTYQNDAQMYQGVFDFLNNSNPGALVGSNHNAHEFDNVGSLSFMDFCAPETFPHTTLSSQFSTSDRASSIPAERFAHVARLWPPKGSTLANDQATQLWTEVVHHKGDNLLTDTSIAETSPAPSIGKENESKWGLDNDKRQAIITEILHDFPSFEDATTTSPGFPSTRLLNLSLDIAFRQSHSSLTCIHRPTYSAKATPNLVVWSMCLMGLMLLDSSQVRALALHYLPAATQHCCTLLATSSFGRGKSTKLIAHLTSAATLLKTWSMCPPRCAQHETLIRMLYNQTFSIAQIHGLFAARPNCPSIDDVLEQFRAHPDTQGQTPSDDCMWKAWARTESVKRLVVCLLGVDAWLAHRLSEPPLIRDPVLRFEHPCSAELFQCSSSKTWKRLIDKGTSIEGRSVLVRLYEPILHLTESPNISPEGVIGLLSIMWIRILEGRHYAAQRTHGEANTPADWAVKLFATDETGRALSRMLDDMFANYATFLRFKNPNCITLWHFLNLHLFADLEVFEVAAGRRGADSAHGALQVIAIWSQTWYARRACLHAAGIYSAMSRRRLNDGSMLHSEASIFAAALVLGLYVFMMGSPRDEAAQDKAPEVEPYELLNDVDWTVFRANGAGTAAFSPASVAPGTHEDSARRFVRTGGAISFSGVICEGGFNAAKMILMEFATLLEEVGKFHAKGLSHVLKVMSDSLVDLDEPMEEFQCPLFLVASANGQTQ